MNSSDGRLDTLHFILRSARIVRLLTAIQILLDESELAIPIDQFPTHRPHIDRWQCPHNRQQHREDGDKHNKRRRMRPRKRCRREGQAQLVDHRREDAQEERQLAGLVNRASLVGYLELRVADRGKLAGTIKHDWIAYLIET